MITLKDSAESDEYKDNNQFRIDNCDSSLYFTGTIDDSVKNIYEISVKVCEIKYGSNCKYFTYNMPVEIETFNKEIIQELFATQNISIPTDFSTETQGTSDGLVLATFPYLNSATGKPFKYDLGEDTAFEMRLKETESSERLLFNKSRLLINNDRILEGNKIYELVYMGSSPESGKSVLTFRLKVFDSDGNLLSDVTVEVPVEGTMEEKGIDTTPLIVVAVKKDEGISLVLVILAAIVFIYFSFGWTFVAWKICRKNSDVRWRQFYIWQWPILVFCPIVFGFICIKYHKKNQVADSKKDDDSQKFDFKKQGTMKRKIVLQELDVSLDSEQPKDKKNKANIIQKSPVHQPNKTPKKGDPKKNKEVDNNDYIRKQTKNRFDDGKIKKKQTISSTNDTEKVIKRQYTIDKELKDQIKADNNDSIFASLNLTDITDSKNQSICDENTGVQMINTTTTRYGSPNKPQNNTSKGLVNGKRTTKDIPTIVRTKTNNKAFADIFKKSQNESKETDADNYDTFKKKPTMVDNRNNSRYEINKIEKDLEYRKKALGIGSDVGSTKIEPKITTKPQSPAKSISKVQLSRNTTVKQKEMNKQFTLGYSFDGSEEESEKRQRIKSAVTKKSNFSKGKKSKDNDYEEEYAPKRKQSKKVYETWDDEEYMPRRKKTRKVSGSDDGEDYKSKKTAKKSRSKSVKKIKKHEESEEENVQKSKKKTKRSKSKKRSLSKAPDNNDFSEEISERKKTKSKAKKLKTKKKTVDDEESVAPKVIFFIIIFQKAKKAKSKKNTIEEDREVEYNFPQSSSPEKKSNNFCPKILEKNKRSKSKKKQKDESF